MKTCSREVYKDFTTAETFEKIIEMQSVSEMWARCLNEYKDREAVYDDGKSFSFEVLEDAAAHFRPLLIKAAESRKPEGMASEKPEGKASEKPEEQTEAGGIRVGILADNSFGFVKAFIAAATLGYTAVILPAQLPKEAVFGCCMKFGIKALVYQENFEEKTELVRKMKPDTVLIKADELSEETADAVRVSGENPCVIMFTGGTTGKSKGVLLSNRAVMQGVVNGCYGYMDVFFERYFLILPLSHVFGLIRNLLTSLYTGSSIFICRNKQNMFKDMAMFRPTILVLVPALAEMALALSKKFNRNMLGGSVKYIICGAAAVPPYLVGEYAKMGITLFPGYGLTESANLVSGNPKCAEKPESVGVMYPNQEYKVVDGELYLKGLNMMDGYVGEDISDAYEDGWFRTGDLVSFDEDGFMYITGRVKEIIVLANGENVSPAEVETHFYELNFVQDCQVFEDVAENGSHFLSLEVVLRQTELANIKAGTEDINSYIMAELNRVNNGLPSYERVNKIAIRDTDFERTPSMKIVRYKKCR